MSGADAPRRPAVREEVAALEGYHSPQVEVAVRLNTNEAPEPPPAEFRAALADELARVEWHRYPDRAYTALREAIAAQHGVAPEQVFAANGSNEVLQTLCLAYAGPGRRVAVFEPTYALHSHIARITGAEVVTGERAADFTLDLGEAARLVRTARPILTYLCSPNNPTGIVDPPDAVAEVLGLAAEVEGLLLVDEAYGQFAPHSALSLVRDDAPLAVARTYSKTWSMAAARLGYLVGPAWLVEQLEKVVLPYHLDVVTQLAGRLALDYTAAMIARVAALVEERGRVAAALAELSVQQWPSGANFILFRPFSRAGELIGEEVWNALLARSILVRNWASWPRLEGCLRVTIGTPAENDAFVAAMKEILS
ncbi:MAG: histidinol-phosphate transaminase [Acidimicrobiales bacterium]